MRTTLEKNYYEILGVSPQASDEQIRQAYYLMALHYHPDRHLGNEATKRHFMAINQAYNMLKTRPQRLAYNRILARRAKLSMAADSHSKPVAASRPAGRLKRFLLVLKEVFWPFALKVQQEASTRG